MFIVARYSFSMWLITHLELKEPRLLPNGTSVKEFTRSKDVDIRRVPPDTWPARIVVSGPWGTFEDEWENLKSFSHDVVPGPNPYTVVPQTTASAFIDYLSAEHADRFIYRGTKCAETFKLIPSAQRTLATTTEEQVEREAKALVRFYDATYEQGLTIPEWSNVSPTVERLRAGVYKWPAGWPPRELHEFIALAQHHRVSTRVLDWSRDPMVAAYFAARPLNLATRSEYVAVWIFDPTAYPSDIDVRGNNRVRWFITVPYDVNPNARAQHGVFTLHNPAYEYDSAKPPTCEPLDEFLSRRALADPPKGLRKVTLPRTEEPALLKLLHRRRINGSTMFPGYDGAVMAANERATWEP